MLGTQMAPPQAESKTRDAVAEARYETWTHWPVNWTAVWVGGLAAFTMVLLFGLVGIALGAHRFGSEYRIVDLKQLGVWTLIFSVCGAFFSFVIGGWIAGKIAGILHSEPGMLHGAIVWLVTVPMLLVTAGLGAGSLFGTWYGELGGTPNRETSASTPYVRPDAVGVGAATEEVAAYRTQQADYNRNVKQWNEDTPKVTRNSRSRGDYRALARVDRQRDRWLDGDRRANALCP
jgi:hypothetical protein